MLKFVIWCSRGGRPCAAGRSRCKCNRSQPAFSTQEIADQRRYDPRSRRRHGPGGGSAARLWRDRRYVGARRGRLARDHTIVVPDLRGLGLSSKPAAGFDKKTQAGDVAGVLDWSRSIAPLSSRMTSATWSAMPSPSSIRSG